MPVRVPWLGREVVIRHDLPADEAFEGKGGQHVETEAEPSDVSHQIIRREVVEDIALRLIAKGEKACKCHGKTSDHGDASRKVGDLGEAVNRRGLEGSID